MSDEPVPEGQPESGNPESPTPRTKRSYSDDDKYIALAAVKLNGGNVYRTALALDIPCATLQDWVEKYEKHELSFSQNPISRERRGSLAAKLEDKVHSIVESIDDRAIKKATLSQRFVAIGIGVDKLRLLLGQGLEPDSATELCKLLQINRTQLPDRLELLPGEDIPAGFGFSGDIIDVEPGEPESIPNPRQSTPSGPAYLRGESHECGVPDCPANSKPSEPLSQEIFTYACNSCNYAVHVPAYRNAEDPNHGPFPCESCHHGTLALVTNPVSQLISHQLGCDLKIPCSCGAHQALLDNNAANSTEDRSPTQPEEPTDGDAQLLESIDDEDSAN